jgi:hypothetical protein
MGTFCYIPIKSSFAFIYHDLGNLAPSVPLIGAIMVPVGQLSFVDVVRPDLSN